jgi:hypothetical protein
VTIQTLGVINPISAREDGTIIAGEQRWHAAQQAGLAEVPVRIYDVDDQQAELLRICENLHRRNLKPSEMLRAVERLYLSAVPELEGDKRVEHASGRSASSRAWTTPRPAGSGWPRGASPRPKRCCWRASAPAGSTA